MYVLSVDACTATVAWYIEEGVYGTLKRVCGTLKRVCMYVRSVDACTATVALFNLLPPRCAAISKALPVSISSAAEKHKRQLLHKVE